MRLNAHRMNVIEKRLETSLQMMRSVSNKLVVAKVVPSRCEQMYNEMSARLWARRFPTTPKCGRVNLSQTRLQKTLLVLCTPRSL